MPQNTKIFTQQGKLLNSRQFLELNLISAIGASLNGEVFLVDHDGFIRDVIRGITLAGDYKLAGSIQNIYEIPGAPKELIDLALSGYPFNDFAIQSPQPKDMRYTFSCRPVDNNTSDESEGTIVLIRPSRNKEGERSMSFATSFNTLVGSDLQFETTKKRAILFAASHKNIFIQGESGTGKELFAQAIHNASRPHDPFVKINCASLTKKHSMRFLSGFAENKQIHPGVLATVQSGTLFLDNIDKLRPDVQPFVMQILDEGEIIPVGSTEPVKTNFRLISASSKNISSNLGANEFRGDFFFRFAHETLDLPPLRERKSDILPLAYLYISRYCTAHKIRPFSLSPKSNELLLSYNWPGNIRELQSVISQACRVTVGGIIQHDAIQRRLLSSPAAGEAESKVYVFPTLKDQERQRILDAYENAGHNVAEAAATLDMSKTTFYRRLKEYGIRKK